MPWSWRSWGKQGGGRGMGEWAAVRVNRLGDGAAGKGRACPELQEGRPWPSIPRVPGGAPGTAAVNLLGVGPTWGWQETDSNLV